MAGEEVLGDEYARMQHAELAHADSLLAGADRGLSSGCLPARLLLVKGAPGPAELAGGEVISGADGDAVHKILAALGFSAEDYFAVVSRPVGTDLARPDVARAVADRMRLIIEAVDPESVVALDMLAAEDISRALDVPALRFGHCAMARGRRLLAVDGLEASLADPQRKRRVWAQFKALTPVPPVW